LGLCVYGRAVCVVKDACGMCACGLWRVGCGVWAVACGLWRVGCGVWAVACGLWRVGCGVWAVACGLWREVMMRVGGRVTFFDLRVHG
jgi:hypothetical protein